jgi:SNF2 family DNA or RNA helicase
VPPVLTKVDDELHLSLSGCRGYEFEDSKVKIKEVAGRRWDPDNKVWVVEATAANADRILKTIHPSADPELLAWVREEMMQAEEALTMTLPDDAELLLPWANKRMPWQPEFVNEEPFNGLLPYQRAGVEAILNGDSRALLGDDMGLGKTIQAIAAVEEWRLRHKLPDGITVPDGPKLVICPSTLKGSWARELHRWLEDPEVVVVKGTYAKRKRATDAEHEKLGHVKDADGNWPEVSAEEVRRLVILDGIERNAWIIVNWEMLRIKTIKRKLRNGGTKTVKVLKEPTLGDTNWLAIIADEIHRAKNKDALQTKGLWRVQTKPIEMGSLPRGPQIGATGTALQNAPDELWAPLAWLYPDEYHERGEAHAQGALPYWKFYDEYVNYYEDHHGRKVITGVKNPDALRFALKGKLIRRTSAILGLKGRKRIFYGLELNPKQQKLYDEAESAMWLAVEKDVAAGNKDAIEFARAALESGNVANLIQIQNGASRLVRLQQIIENPALIGGDDDSAIMDDFEEKFEDSGGLPWVFFFKYKQSCSLFAERLRKKGAKVGIYNGDVDPAVRTKLEDMFQRGDLDAMIGTLDAMREGITLTRSHLVAFGTRSFVPAHNEQAESRCDRLGQQDLVRVYIPQAEGTVATDKVEPINRLKESIVRSVVAQEQIEEVRR